MDRNISVYVTWYQDYNNKSAHSGGEWHFRKPSLFDIILLSMIFLLVLITKICSNPIKAAHSRRGHDFGGVEWHFRKPSLFDIILLSMNFLLTLITKICSNPIKATHSGRGHDLGGGEWHFRKPWSLFGINFWAQIFYSYWLQRYVLSQSSQFTQGGGMTLEEGMTFQKTKPFWHNAFVHFEYNIFTHTHYKNIKIAKICSKPQSAPLRDGAWLWRSGMTIQKTKPFSHKTF